MENSHEIEKMFYQDIGRQKRIGRGVHSRKGKGSDKAGVVGGVKFVSSFKKYERKNSKVKSQNLYDNVTSYDHFQTFSKEHQKDLLSAWLLRYTKTYIQTKMDVGETKLNNMINELEIKEEGEPMRVDEEVLNKYKNGKMQPHEFKLLPDDQKFEVVDYIQKNQGLTNKQIADIVGMKINSFNARKSKWKNAWEQRFNKEGDEVVMPKNNPSFLLDTEDEEENNSYVKEEKQPDNTYVKPESQPKPQSKPSSNMTKPNVQDDGNAFRISFNGSYNGDKIKKKIEAMGFLLDDDEDYDVTFSIKGK